MKKEGNIPSRGGFPNGFSMEVSVKLVLKVGSKIQVKVKSPNEQ